MNFRGNTFSLPKGRVMSAGQREGINHIFLEKKGAICRVDFDSAQKTLTNFGIVSYAEACFLSSREGLFELRNGKLRYE